MNMKVYKKVAVIAAAMLAVFSWDVRGSDDLSPDDQKMGGGSLEEQLKIYFASEDGKNAIKGLVKEGLKECFSESPQRGSASSASSSSLSPPPSLAETLAKNISKKLKTGFWMMLFGNFTSTAVIFLTFKKFGLI